MGAGTGAGGVMRSQVTIDQVIELLNAAVKADPEAMHQLIEARVPCNKWLAQHPTIQVVAGQDPSHQVGLLGILNGQFGIDERRHGPIAAVFDDDMKLKRFERTSKMREDRKGQETVPREPT